MTVWSRTGRFGPEFRSYDDDQGAETPLEVVKTVQGCKLLKKCEEEEVEGSISRPGSDKALVNMRFLVLMSQALEVPFFRVAPTGS
ncbi:hypothetical protein FQN49_007946 [Arthroderma sp. PD_2]|nr:hypothetical protein FQN49_007946 [Arthroderma sp. PD_2]